MFNDELDDFSETGNHRIGVFGSRRSLFELGKYFLGLATFHTKDPKHYQYLEGLEVKDGFKPCKFFVRLPNEPELKIKNGKVIVPRKK